VRKKDFRISTLRRQTRINAHNIKYPPPHRIPVLRSGQAQMLTLMIFTEKASISDLTGDEILN
jgi:hypothetical protein